ncbi:hypothetical protein GCM10023264_22030 [Sphingomonas daechungensis]|uniref:Glycosyltransferase family 25 protein n=1 Tax=Sphingomonas daechungensis TaxID=1176646 RepID=A0ABX6T7S3_9SPHN|nr:hypothetical protein [Sphingomonas daechungensis]QNP43713.1 hypothetical protein H9L15_03275 [Sphingomonas daechungensis]
MQSSVFTFFDRVRVINLADRPDRKREIKRDLRPLGWTPDESDFLVASRPVVSGPFISIGAHGCFQSHARAVREAARAKESLLILEDDCSFLPEAGTYEVPDCDIFYGGWNELAEDGDYVVGSHCMGFSRRAVQLLDSYLAAFLAAPADPKAMTEPGFDPAVKPGIDGAYVWFRRAHPELTTVFANLSFQRSSRSDVTPGRLDQISFLRTPLSVARRFKTLAAR